jgi:Ribbon-helix-helix protein, copG family
MASRHLTLRLGESALAHLDREAGRSGQTRSELARTLIEEGLRMREHPGIVFRNGTAGRRPAIAGGPQIWWIASILRGFGLGAKNLEQRTVALTELPPDQVSIARRYYTDYPDEIDAFIDRNNEEGERGYAEWLREQSLSA